MYIVSHHCCSHSVSLGHPLHYQCSDSLHWATCNSTASSCCPDLNTHIRPSCPLPQRALHYVARALIPCAGSQPQVEILFASLGLWNSATGHQPLLPPMGMPSLLQSKFDTLVAAATPLNVHRPHPNQDPVLHSWLSWFLYFCVDFCLAQLHQNDFRNELFMKGNGAQLHFKVWI